MFSGLMVSNRTLPNRILSRTPICKITTINVVPPEAAFHLFLSQTFWDRVVGPHGFETQFEKHLLGHYKGWSALIHFDEADIQEQAMFTDDQAWFSEPRHMTVLGQTRRGLLYSPPPQPYKISSMDYHALPSRQCEQFWKNYVNQYKVLRRLKKRREMKL